MPSSKKGTVKMKAKTKARAKSPVVGQKVWTLVMVYPLHDGAELTEATLFSTRAKLFRYIKKELAIYGEDLFWDEIKKDLEDCFYFRRDGILNGAKMIVDCLEVK